MFAMTWERFEVWGKALVSVWVDYLGSFSIFTLKSSHAKNGIKASFSVVWF